MNKNTYTNTHKGFTLIELLVVIAIIGLLAAIVLASLGSVRERAQVTRMVSDLEQIELAFNMWLTAEGWARWPDATEIGSDSDDQPISEILENENLSSYLNTVPEPPFGEGEYLYDNHGNSRDSCTDQPAASVNLVVENVDQEIIEEISRIVDNDDGDLDCGKVVEYVGGNDLNFRYNLSLDQSF